MTPVKFETISIPADTVFFVLEDTELYQKKFLSTLNDLGFTGNVILASTLAEAVTKLSQKKPGYFLSDWNLPDGKGIDFLKIVRSNDLYKNVPFVMVTTMDSIDDILDAVNNGADDYLVKPWEEAEMLEKIAYAYEKRTK